MEKILKKIGLPVFILAMLVNLSLDSQGNLSIMNDVKAAPETTAQLWSEITVDCINKGVIYAQVKACTGGTSKDCNPDSGCPPPPTEAPPTIPL